MEERPLIQIDNEIRPMTDEEFADYEETIANSPVVPGTE